MNFGLDAFLEIPSGLDQSITIAVLVGLAVMLLLAEAFGWVFVGVVVPGYLASVLLIQPAAGIAVVVDSILTYLIARVLAGILRVTDASSAFFGRERFFLIILVSVLVRQHTHNWIIPWTVAKTGLSQALSYEFTHSLASLGLVLVPLMANIFWKLDLRRGLLQSAVAVAITYAVLAFWLLPTTSLSYNSLELSYENTALDFLGNAKAYLIMLVTAYISAQLNLRYGWDFGGILIPALLALLWFTPSKLATTLLESLVLFASIKLALKAPILRTANLEGPRKTALVFTVGVILKWIIGASVSASLPTVKVTDLYGFGYLLPTLLTLRMLKRKSVRGIVLPTLLASILGLTVASILGFILELAYPARPDDRVPQFDAPTSPLLDSPVGVGALAHARALDPRVLPRSNRELVSWASLWNAIDGWLEHPDAEHRTVVRRLASRLSLELQRIRRPSGSRTAYALIESEGDWSRLRRWETALLIPGASGPVLEVPHPVQEPLTAEVAMLICPRIDCRAVLVVGQDRDADSSRSFASAGERLRAAWSIEIRADSNATAGRPSLEIPGKLPVGTRFDRIWPDRIELDWSSANADSRSQRARLRINPRDLERLVARRAPPPRFEIDLLTWLRAREPTPSGPARQPTLTELRALDHLVLERAWQWTEGNRAEDTLDRLGFYAHLLDTEVLVFERCGTTKCVALVPASPHSALAELVLLRGPEAPPVAIEVPRARHVLGTAQLGLELWLEQYARALVISEAQTDDGGSGLNPMLPGQTVSSFQAVHQALDRRLAAVSRSNPLIIQVNGYSDERNIDADVIIGVGRPATEAEAIPLPVLSLFTGDGAFRFVEDFRFSDATAELYALSGSGVPQFEYSLELGQAQIAGLWFSPRIRDRFRVLDNRMFHEQFERLGLELVPGDEVELLRHGLVAISDEGEAATTSDERLSGLEDIALAWKRSHNIHFGGKLIDRVRRDTRVNMTAHLGLRSMRPLLLFETRTNARIVRSAVFLDDFAPLAGVTAQTRNEAANLARTVLSRPAVVRITGAPRE